MAGWMNYEDAAWYGSRPRPRPHCTRRGPSSRERATAAPLFSARVYCGHSRPSQLLLSSCNVVERWLSAELCKLSLQAKHQKIDVFVNVKYSRIAEDGTNFIFRRPFINGSPYPNRPLSVTLVHCGQTVGWIKMKIGMQVVLGPDHIVLDGDPAPPKGHSPQFSAHICCSQMAR